MRPLTPPEALRLLLVRTILAIGCLAAAAAPAAPATLEGRVLQAASGAIYLDRGALDGLSMGSRIDLRNARGETRALTVTGLSDHHAVAAPAVEEGTPLPFTASAGDAWTSSVATPTATVADSTAPAARATQAVDPETIANGWKAALAESAPLRPYHREGQRETAVSTGRNWIRVTPVLAASPYHAGGWSTYAEGLLTIRSMASLSQSGHLSLEADCDVQDWVKRPDRDRLRPTANGSVLLHALGIAYAPPGSGASVSLGRGRLASEAGAPIIDGGALSWVSAPRGLGGMESRAIGAYGGYLPDPLTLSPATDRLSIGAFGRTAGRVASGLDGSIRGRLSLLHKKGASREDGQVILSLGKATGLLLDGGAAVAHGTGISRLTDGWIGLRQRFGSGEMSVRHRESEPLLDPTQAVAYREVLGDLSSTPGRTRHTELRLARPGLLGATCEAFLGRHDGSNGFDRWTADARLAGGTHLGPVRRWLVGYRGSSGWQAGHEGELGLGLDLSRWAVDLSAGGGVLHQDRADLTGFIGRGSLGIRRPLGRDGSLSLFAWGEAQRHSLATAGRLSFSWQFRGRR